MNLFWLQLSGCNYFKNPTLFFPDKQLEMTSCYVCKRNQLIANADLHNIIEENETSPETHREMEDEKKIRKMKKIIESWLHGTVQRH